MMLHLWEESALHFLKQVLSRQRVRKSSGYMKIFKRGPRSSSSVHTRFRKEPARATTIETIAAPELTPHVLSDVPQ